MSWLRAVFPMILEIAQGDGKLTIISGWRQIPVKPFRLGWGRQNLLIFPLSAASPGVSERLFGAVAHAGVLLHHVADEIFRCE